MESVINMGNDQDSIRCSRIGKRELYLIDYDHHHIVYAPLSRMCFSVSEAIAELIVNGKAFWPQKIHEYIKAIDARQIRIIDSKAKGFANFNKLMVIPTQICNLGCVYCYAHEAHSDESISLPMFSKAIASWASLINNKGEVSFIGGGEPLFNWNLFTKCVEIIKEQSEKMGLLVSIAVTTNGPLLTDERIKWLADNSVKVGVSFDVLPDVQNSNRPFRHGAPSHSVVLTNIKKLVSAGITQRIRTTITRSCVCRMTEMVDYVAKNIPGIKSLHFEHVTLDEDASDDFYEQFVESFWDAKRSGRQYDMKIRNSIQTSFMRLSNQFCRGELCLTPDGSFVSCHRVSSRKDTWFNEFFMGDVGKGVLANKTDKIPQCHQLQHKCMDCFCKWHCGGGCPMMNMTLSENGRSAYCRFVKRFILHLIIDHIMDNKKGGDRGE